MFGEVRRSSTFLGLRPNIEKLIENSCFRCFVGPDVAKKRGDESNCLMSFARTLRRPGAPAVGDMWCELHLLSVSVRNSCLKTARQDAEATWGSSCQGYVGSVSVLFIWCWDGPPADLGLQLSGICGVCICSCYLVLGGEKEEERRSGEEEKSNNPNLKGGEQP